MTAADYALPRHAAARPDYNPCAQAAKAGNMKLLKSLRREGHPWNTEVQRCGAWAGHLHVLRYAARMLDIVTTADRLNHASLRIRVLQYTPPRLRVTTVSGVIVII